MQPAFEQALNPARLPAEPVEPSSEVVVGQPEGREGGKEVEGGQMGGGRGKGGQVRGGGGRRAEEGRTEGRGRCSGVGNTQRRTLRAEHVGMACFLVIGEACACRAAKQAHTEQSSSFSTEAGFPFSLYLYVVSDRIEYTYACGERRQRERDRETSGAAEEVYTLAVVSGASSCAGCAASQDCCGGSGPCI